MARFLLVRGERTFVQDPTFGFRQLVDIAIRALSPAVNDPTTAAQAIDRLGDLLVVAAVHPDPTGFRIDAAGQIRLRRPWRDFEALLLLSLTEIVRYGFDAPQIVRRLHATLDDLDRALPPERRPAVARQRELLTAAVASGMPPTFQTIASTADRLGLG